MKTVITFLAFALMVSTSALGQRIYGGASIGSSFQNKKVTDLSGQDFKINKTGFAWKAFGGVSWKFIGIEGGYRDLGEVKDTRTVTVPGGSPTNVEGTAHTRGGDVFAKGTLKIAIIEIFGKAGGFFRRTDRSLFDADSGQDLGNLINERTKNVVFAWGFGAGVNIGPLGIRLEWESLEINPDDLSMLSLGATIGFGGK